MVIFPPAFGSSMTRVPPVKGAVDRKFLSLAGDGTKIFRLPAFGALDIRSRSRGISPSADGDNGYSPLTSVAFL